MTAQPFAEKHVLVAGLAGGREVFLGKAVDEALSDALTLEGKSLFLTPRGLLGAKPFTTRIRLPLRDPNHPIQRVVDAEAGAECDEILSTSRVCFDRAAFPLLHRWVESSVAYGPRHPAAEAPLAEHGNLASIHGCLALHDGFVSTAEQFHRLMFQLPQVGSPRELDRLSELKGNLTIEMDKITNQIAIKLNNLVVNEPRLSSYFEAVEGAVAHAPGSHVLGTWSYLMNRFEVARVWARRQGKTMLIREIDALAKEGILGVNEVVLDSCSALDTLISEASTQYGISSEAFGELSPFAGVAASHPRAVEAAEVPTAGPVGSGI
jgi:hypothetical protein